MPGKQGLGRVSVLGCQGRISECPERTSAEQDRGMWPFAVLAPLVGKVHVTEGI